MISISFCFSFALKPKSSTHKKNEIIGNGNIIEKELDYSSFNTIILDQAYDYYLDPHSNKTTIKSDDNILPHVNFSTHKGVLNFKKILSNKSIINLKEITPRGEILVKPSQPIMINVGIKGLTELSIICDNEKVNSYKTIKKNLITKDTIQLDRLNLHSGRFHKINLMINVETLNIDNRPFSNIKLSGKTNQMEIKSEMSGVIEASNLEACDTKLSVHQSSSIQINSSCKISGVVKTHSKVVNHSKASQNNLVLISAKYSEI